VLTDQLDEPTDVTVHIDTEEDEKAPPIYLPLRSELMPVLSDYWSDICDIPIQRVDLHYHDKKIGIELFLSTDDVDDMDKIERCADQLQQKYADEDQVETIRLGLLVQ
jgi:hypothetical protein